MASPPTGMRNQASNSTAGSRSRVATDAQTSATQTAAAATPATRRPGRPSRRATTCPSGSERSAVQP